MNIFKKIEYKQLEHHMDEIDSHLGFLSASGIKGVPDLAHDMRNLLNKISDKIDEKYTTK